MNKLKELDFSDVGFSVESSQQFATVIFDRAEDSESCAITIVANGKINQFVGNNRYNPSGRRHSSCVYVQEEWEDGEIIKICTIQHKGTTFVEVHSVTLDEMEYLFPKR
ncbi:hypothetical protein [Stutzerimonas nitrititolerans]|uniref:hypothetical protein n=1 Tax=Stutzerimonas nitrititolerans TaxID=2482751 RepID=UPI0028B0E46E|nr:hypothetical protein [Stutzerimonas nitrititolerans]